MEQPKVGVVMGSDSDFQVVKKAIKVLKDMDITVEARVISAHRTPEKAEKFAKEARNNGFDVIIAAAGKAAHLPGILAAFTTVPVIGIPIKSSALDGMDALLSIAQMPPGIPVATVGIDGAQNAGLLAAQILSLKYTEIVDKLEDFRAAMAAEVEKKDAKIREEAADI